MSGVKYLSATTNLRCEFVSVTTTTLVTSAPVPAVVLTWILNIGFTLVGFKPWYLISSFGFTNCKEAALTASCAVPPPIAIKQSQLAAWYLVTISLICSVEGFSFNVVYY